jgi:hypothetical protein
MIKVLKVLAFFGTHLHSRQILLLMMIGSFENYWLRSIYVVLTRCFTISEGEIGLGLGVPQTSPMDLGQGPNLSEQAWRLLQDVTFLPTYSNSHGGTFEVRLSLNITRLICIFDGLLEVLGCVLVYHYQ